MADELKTKRISELPLPPAALGDADYLPVVQAGGTYRVILSAVSAYVNSKLPANVGALAGLSGAADTLPYFNGAGLVTAAFTAYARSLLDDANATAAQATLGLPALISASSRAFKMNVVAQDSSATLSTTGTGVCYQCSTAGAVLTLPAGVTPGLTYSFRNNSLGNITISAVAGQNIAAAPGAATQTIVLQSGEWLEVQSNNPAGQYFVTGRGYTGAGVPALTTPRNIAITGDATWSTSFDGSANATGALTLAATGVAAGTYGQVTVDAKGRVTAAQTVNPVANGGTGRTTVALYLADLVAAGAYSKTSVLGTVSQAAGVPTGAVIERGSNANGEYVKYADGTMIATLTRTETVAITTAYGSTFQGAAAIWNFPVAFVGNIPVVTCVPRVSGKLLISAINADHTLTTANFAVIELGGVSSSPSVINKYLAIGRWF